MNEGRPLGPYRIEHRLATGGMAEIFVARREGMHGFSKRVAVKRILPQFASDPDFVWMFIDEARLAAQLEHPNIVQVFDFGNLGEDLVLVMELVDGTNVGRLLRAVGKRIQIPWDITLHMGHETAKALEYAHSVTDEGGASLEFVHRDVSPANILFTRSGHVKLTDFGIATVRSRAPTTEDGQVRGKLGYMSPEQVLGKELVGKSDVFTLATVMAEMLIGEPLFAGESELNVLLRIRDADLGVFARSNRHVPQDIQQLIFKALQRDPDARPSAGAFAEACAEIMRRRAMAHAADRLARFMKHLGLVSTDSEEDIAEGISDTTMMDSGLVHQEAEPAVVESGAPAPSVYSARLPDGSEMGPMSYPKLVQLFATGVLDHYSRVAKSDGRYVEAREVTELARFVTSPGLQWRVDEIARAERQGVLRPASILGLFADIVIEKQTGVLHLWDGKRRKKIYFIEGRPEFIASTDKSELLGEHLVATSRCLRMEVEMALALLPKYGGRLGDALVGMGVLRPVELFRAISEQVRARLMEAFRWRQGEWAFIRGARSHEETFPLGLEPYAWLIDGARAVHLEEIESSLTPRREWVVRPDKAGPPLEMFQAPQAWVDVIQSVRSDSTVGSLIAQAGASGSDLESVYRALYLGLACRLLTTDHPTMSPEF